MTKKIYPPVIILGMHRSGTSLIARCLERTGLFLGKEKDKNEEAMIFQKINEWILKQVNASWDNPHNFLFLNEIIKKELLRVINFHLTFYLSRKSYLGPFKAIRYKSLRKIDFPWGWKDPRNTFTILLWKTIFPEAKIVHVYRHPVDVAVSLMRREKIERKIPDSGKRIDMVGFLKEIFLKGRIGYQQSIRVENFKEGVKLWNSYIKAGFELDEKYPNQVLHICYEKFVFDPEAHLERLMSFINLKIDESKVKKAVYDVKSDRAFSFLKDMHPKEFFKQRLIDEELLVKLGYDKIENLNKN